MGWNCEQPYSVKYDVCTFHSMCNNKAVPSMVTTSAPVERFSDQTLRSSLLQINNQTILIIEELFCCWPVFYVLCIWQHIMILVIIT